MSQEKIIVWLPVVVWYGFISFLSSLPGGTVSSIPSIILRFFDFPGSPFTKIPMESYLFWGHRMAHIIEYGVLGCLVMRAYAKGVTKVTVSTVLMLSLFIFLSGSLDEWHQSFVPGRTADLIDALFDTICGTLGMLKYKMFILNKI